MTQLLKSLRMKAQKIPVRILAVFLKMLPQPLAFAHGVSVSHNGPMQSLPIDPGFRLYQIADQGTDVEELGRAFEKCLGKSRTGFAE